MAATSTDHQLQKLLQTAVQSVKWTYSLFWQVYPEQSMLVWGDGYYNGAIKTRKTVEPVEVTTEEACLQRSQQLRELYDFLSAGDANQQTRRPSTALSPEDLTESEWFYLMCVSFSFPLGVGLPGRAYEKQQHIWLTGANAVDGKVFNRAILAKSAQVQTILCIPLLEGVVELGTTERVEEDIEIIQKVKHLFINYHSPTTNNNQTPKPAVSGHSTASNPSLAISYNHSPPALIYTPTDEEDDDHDHDDQVTNEDQEVDNDDQLDDEDHNNNNNSNSNNNNSIVMMLMSSDHARGGASIAAADDHELMQVDMCESVRVGSPPDHDYDLLFPTVASKPQAAESPSTHGAHAQLPSAQNTLHFLPHTETPPVEHDQLPHYSQTVSSILQRQSLRRCSDPCNTVETSRSAFTAATTTTQSHHNAIVNTNNERTSQCLLKHILFTVPLLHTTATKSQGESTTVDFRKPTFQDELSTNHVLAERRRREKLNERFIILRSLIPFVTKMDKASILADAVEYVKQLVKRVQDLEESCERMRDHSQRKDKKKMRVVELLPHMTEEVEVEVSIIESDGLVEMRCPWREGLLLDVMQKLREYRMEITTVQSSSNDGVLVAELRAKVKENPNGKKVSIVEVKRAIKHIIKLC